MGKRAFYCGAPGGVAAGPVLGDSFAFGQGVKDENVFPVLLERLLPGGRLDAALMTHDPPLPPVL